MGRWFESIRAHHANLSCGCTRGSVLHTTWSCVCPWHVIASERLTFRPAWTRTSSNCPSSVNPPVRQTPRNFRLPGPGGRSILLPHHDHKLVLTEDRVGLRFYDLQLGTDRLQRRGVGLPGWLLFRMLIHHAFCTLDTGRSAAVVPDGESVTKSRRTQDWGRRQTRESPF
jgi:hypothetical protein